MTALTIKDLKPYIDFYDVKEVEDDTAKVFYMVVESTGPLDMHLEIKSQECALNLTEAEAIKQIDTLFNSFTTTVENNPVEIERAKNTVAKKTRRGRANLNYNNTWFYKGSYKADSPVIVAHCDGRYAVFSHPKFDDYGFRIGG